MQDKQSTLKVKTAKIQTEDRTRTISQIQTKTLKSKIRKTRTDQTQTEDQTLTISQIQTKTLKSKIRKTRTDQTPIENPTRTETTPISETHPMTTDLTTDPTPIRLIHQTVMKKALTEGAIKVNPKEKTRPLSMKR